MSAMIQKEDRSSNAVGSFNSAIRSRKLIIGMGDQDSTDREKERLSPSFPPLEAGNEIDGSSKATRKRKLGTAGVDANREAGVCKLQIDDPETDTKVIKQKRQQSKPLNSGQIEKIGPSRGSPGKKDGGTFEESLEKARALSRLYSQRNRDKQKNTIENLTQEKFRLGNEKTALEESNRQLKEALQAAKAENQLLRNAGFLAASAAHQGQQQPHHRQHQQQIMAHSLFPMRATSTSTATGLPPLLASSWNGFRHPQVDSLYAASAAGSATSHGGLSHLPHGGRSGGMASMGNNSGAATHPQQRYARGRGSTDQDLILSLLRYNQDKSSK